jgi:hypothetical protein
MTKKQNGVNPVNGKSLDDLYQHTQDKIQYIKDQGYNVVEMWECQWLASGLQIIRDVKINFQSTKQLLVHDSGQYLVLCHGDQTITWSFSIFNKTTQFGSLLILASH